jgi:hypothetical protein
VRLLRDGRADCVFLTQVLTLGSFAGPAEESLSELGEMWHVADTLLRKAFEADLS